GREKTSFFRKLPNEHGGAQPENRGSFLALQSSSGRLSIDRALTPNCAGMGPDWCPRATGQFRVPTAPSPPSVRGALRLQSYLRSCQSSRCRYPTTPVEAQQSVSSG